MIVCWSHALRLGHFAPLCARSLSTAAVESSRSCMPGCERLLTAVTVPTTRRGFERSSRVWVSCASTSSARAAWDSILRTATPTRTTRQRQTRCSIGWDSSAVPTPRDDGPTAGPLELRMINGVTTESRRLAEHEAQPRRNLRQSHFRLDARWRSSQAPVDMPVPDDHDEL